MTGAKHRMPSSGARPAMTTSVLAARDHPSGQLSRGERAAGLARGPWAVWWFSLLTLGIYYLVWYYKINGDLRRFAPQSVRVKPGLAVLAQFVPIVGLVSIANTAGRLRAAHASVASPVEVSGAVTVLSAFWFASQTRYLQRRLNALWDAAAAEA